MSRTCSAARALEIVGERWSLLVLRELLLGVRRFEQIRAATGAPRAVLADRLRGLVDAGLLTRREYRDTGARARFEYRLTDAGRELQPVLIALMQWGDKHRTPPGGPPLRVTHAGCGAPVRARLMCADGHELGDDGRDLRAEPADYVELDSRLSVP
jgi:DNA-binding HxlR family transcriptional regulator